MLCVEMSNLEKIRLTSSPYRTTSTTSRSLTTRPHITARCRTPARTLAPHHGVPATSVRSHLTFNRDLLLHDLMLLHFIGVPVYAAPEDNVPATIMWFFDSRSFVSGTGNGPGPVPDGAGEAWIDEESVPGYVRAQTQLMRDAWGGAVPPALVFTHIPVRTCIASTAKTYDGVSAVPTRSGASKPPDPG